MDGGIAGNIFCIFPQCSENYADVLGYCLALCEGQRGCKALFRRECLEDPLAEMSRIGYSRGGGGMNSGYLKDGSFRALIRVVLECKLPEMTARWFLLPLLLKHRAIGFGSKFSSALCDTRS